MKVEEVCGLKSKSDKIILLSADREAVAFKELAFLLARITKNEQVISDEIAHYTQGSDILKRFINEILDTNWKEMSNKDIMETIGEQYDRTKLRR